MDFIGFDLGKISSQVCILTEDGELIERRICTNREQMAKLLGNRASARILIESSTESEWVARFLEELGHQVVVADPGFAPMYARRTRQVKTDKRDARTLAEACRLGAYRCAHRTSDKQRHVRANWLCARSC
jgi:transposase